MDQAEELRIWQMYEGFCRMSESFFIRIIAGFPAVSTAYFRIHLFLMQKTRERKGICIV